MKEHDRDDVSRRTFVTTATVAGAFGLAGCMGNGDDATTTTDGGSDGGDGDGDGGDGDDGGNELNILHGWTGSDGSRAAEALVSTFEEKHPDIPMNVEPIGGGGNQNLDTVVANRLQAGDPPSSFANWPGPNLQKYEGVLGNVDDVWEANDFADSHIDEAVDLHQMGGTFRAVPLGSHQLNCLFYNISVVEDAGVDPDSLTDVPSLMDALETVGSETDAIPMTQAMSGTWTITQLWTQIMLGQEGFQPYMDFIEGNGSESAVRSAFETLAEIHENHISDDAASLNLTTSMENIINGDAAFIHQGNWAAGAFRGAENFEYDSEWGYVPFPGTGNMYTLHFDSMLYPSDNPSPENSKTWLSYIGSEDAQVAFNQYKGSIPTRTDVSMDEFGPYLQDAADQFANAEHRPPTLQHGLAVPAATMTSLNDVISQDFTGPYNVDAATSGFLDAV